MQATTPEDNSFVHVCVNMCMWMYVHVPVADLESFVGGGRTFAGRSLVT